MKNICIHTVNIGDYFPELTQYTLPTIKDFAYRIDADLNIITERKFPQQEVLVEKLQVYEDGKPYDYNILLDLDILVHPQCYNPFLNNIPPTHVSFKDNYDANKQLRSDIYFERDGRNVGISGCAIFTNKYTHDLWKPIDDLTIEQINNNILQERKIVDEYTMSRNFAKYGFKYVQPYPLDQYNLLYHLGTYGQDKEKMLDNAKTWYNYFWR